MGQLSQLQKRQSIINIKLGTEFEFNIDSALVHLEKNMALITGEFDETAFVYKIDLSLSLDYAKLTNKLAIKCECHGYTHVTHSHLVGDKLYYMYDFKNVALIDAKNLNIIK